MKARFVIIALLLATPLAAAQDSTPQSQIDISVLGRTFRHSSPGAILPLGRLYTAYFGRAGVASTSPPTCMMQVLTIYDHRGIDESPPQLAVDTRLRFLTRNDGARLAPLPGDAIAQQCAQQEPTFGWFSAYPAAQADAVLFAAWQASGAFLAIGAGKAEYQGFDLSPYLDLPATPAHPVSARLTLEEFCRQTGHAPSDASVRTTAAGSEATVTFGGGRGGGFMVEVNLSFTEAYNTQRGEIERRLTAIEVGPLTYYVV